jgi:RNA polymerase sigma-70 factor (ECF subfamily)
VGEDALPDDRDLLARIAGGDQAALGALYDRYVSAAFGLALRILADHGTAEEVVQDAFVAVWRRADSYRAERGEPRSWLLSIVHHRAIDRVRGPSAAARRAEVELDPALDSVDGADVWSAAWAQLARAEIEAALASLPAEQREAIDLAFFGGLTHVEVAERTGQPLGTIKGRMRLGLQKLRTELQGRAVEPAL